MYGPLNGVRVALVTLAGLAVITLLAVGQPLGALFLAAGVALHGYGWVYLKRKAAQPDRSPLELGR